MKANVGQDAILSYNVFISDKIAVTVDMTMINCFQDELDLTSYTCRPANISLGETNPVDAYGAEASLAMNFTKEDVRLEYEWSLDGGRDGVKNLKLESYWRSAFD